MTRTETANLKATSAGYRARTAGMPAALGYPVRLDVLESLKENRIEDTEPNHEAFVRGYLQAVCSEILGERGPK